MTDACQGGRATPETPIRAIVLAAVLAATPAAAEPLATVEGHPLVVVPVAGGLPRLTLDGRVIAGIEGDSARFPVLWRGTVRGWPKIVVHDDQGGARCYGGVLLVVSAKPGSAPRIARVPVTDCDHLPALTSKVTGAALR